MITNIIKQSVLVLLATVLLPLQGMGQGATLSIEDFSIKGGETQTMLIDVDNASMEVSQVEFFMHLPQGLSVSTENGLLAVDIAGRTTYRNHSLDAGIEDGDIHVILYSSTSSLTGTNGAVFSVKLVAAESFIGGNIVLKGQVLVSPDETESKPADYTYRVTTGAAPGTIIFADAEVKRLCVENWDTDGDGELSQAEAAAVMDIGTLFRNNKTMTSFDEFQYFTGVTVINNHAFSDCQNLVSIKMPNTIETINTSSFYDCYKLTSIGFPVNSGFRLVGLPFWYCSALTSVTLPKNLTSMEGNPFCCCYNLSEINVDAANSNYKSVNGVVYTIDGNTIVAYPAGKEQTEYAVANGTKTIGGYAFNNCSKLQKVTLPSSVTSLENSSFTDCGKLSSVNIPSTVTNIGTDAFSRCEALTDVILPSSLISIGSYAFWWCSSFTTITIPNSVTNIGTAVFAGCTGLESIKVEGGNTMYDSRNNCNAIIRKSDNALISGCKNTIIPSSVTSISHYAFRSCQDLVSITIPNTITSVGYEAFAYCYGLSSITIPASVSSIGNNAFRSCNGLTEVRSMILQPFAIADNVFQRYIDNVLQFTTATLYVPKGTKSKYETTDGWKNFKNIVEIEGPEGDIITFADAEVKRLCVENWDTDGDGELSQAEAAAVTDLGQVFKGNSTINTFEELRFFTGLTAIGSRAFYNCNMLAKLSIPSSVTSICDHAFYGCYSLTSIAIPNSVTSLEPFAFCFTGLQTFTIPNSVTTLGDAVFNYSQSLRSVVIPGSVVSMGFNPLNGCSCIETIVVEGDNPAFDSRNNCNAIINTETNELVSGCKNTVIPANVTSIGKYAFGGCQYLKGITIPNSVTKIGVSSFYWCDRMTEITIPGSVNSIGANAFQDCDGLTKVTALMNQPFPIDENVFKYYDYSDKEYKFTTATLYVPAGTKEIYQNTAGWSLFQNIVEMGGEEPTPDIVRNVVMEEATGAWCGWCIRGIVSMKQAKEEFGDRFIGIAVHSSDVMSLNSYYGLNINGYPSCNIDRDGGIYDPSDLYVVRGRMNVAPTVGVSVKGEWNADKTTVTATSETQFLADGDGYSVAYVLVADGLTGTSSRWNQNNAYSGRTSSDPDLQAYCEMGSPITDMVYNDVMVGSSYSSSGVNQAESFGGTVKKGDKKSNSYTLSLPATGELAAAIDKNQVYVVAIVTNPDGTIANAAKAKVGGKAGDVNGDNTVDVADIASVISVMAKGGKDSVADVNVDGVVDVADISTIISIMAANARMGQTVE